MISGGTQTKKVEYHCFRIPGDGPSPKTQQFRVLYTSPEPFRICLDRFVLSTQPYGRQVPRVQRDLGYGDIGSRRVLKIECGKFLMMK
jgi:hypothetical protein